MRGTAILLLKSQLVTKNLIAFSFALLWTAMTCSYTPNDLRVATLTPHFLMVCATLCEARVHMHQCVHQQEPVCFDHYLPWILSMVFNADTADGLCFISRLVCGARSGIPWSPLICCQIFINVTELSTQNDAKIFC